MTGEEGWSMLSSGHEANGHSGGFCSTAEKTLIWCLPCAFLRQFSRYDEALHALAAHMGCARADLEWSVLEEVA
jgi:hypothetical protein